MVEVVWFGHCRGELNVENAVSGRVDECWGYGKKEGADVALERVFMCACVVFLANDLSEFIAVNPFHCNAKISLFDTVLT